MVNEWVTLCKVWLLRVRMLGGSGRYWRWGWGWLMVVRITVWEEAYLARRFVCFVFRSFCLAFVAIF